MGVIEREYEDLKKDREPFLEEATFNEQLTCEVGARETHDGEPQHESAVNKNTTGGTVLNGLASTLTTTMLPSQQPFFDLRLEGEGADRIEDDKELADQTAEDTADARRRAIVTFERVRGRSTMFCGIRGALVAGQVAAHAMKDRIRLFPLPNFVTRYVKDRMTKLITMERTKSARKKPIYTEIDFEKNRVRQQGSDGKTKVIKGERATRWFVIATEPPISGFNFSKAYCTQYAVKMAYLNEITWSIQTIMNQVKDLIIGYRAGSGIKKSALEETGPKIIPMQTKDDVWAVSLGQKLQDLSVATQERVNVEAELRREFLFGLLERRPLPETATLAREMIAELNALGAMFYAHLGDAVLRPLARALLELSGYVLEVGDMELEPIILTGATALSKQEGALRLMQTLQMATATFPELPGKMDDVYITKRLMEGFDVETDHLFLTSAPGTPDQPNPAETGATGASPASANLDVNETAQSLAQAAPALGLAT